MKKHRKWAALLIVPALLILASSGALANGTIVSVGDGEADSIGDTAEVKVAITGVIDLGAIDLDLDYDDGVVEPTNITWGDLGPALGCSGVPIVGCLIGTSGTIELNWFFVPEPGEPGPTGDFDLAYITFEAVECDTSTILDLTVVEVVDTDLVPILHDVEDGLFTVTCEEEPPPPPPPVGGTGQMPNKLGILAPWIAGGTALAIGLGWFVVRRRKSQQI